MALINPLSLSGIVSFSAASFLTVSSAMASPVSHRVVYDLDMHNVFSRASRNH